MIFPSLSRSSLLTRPSAKNFMNRWRNCKSLPANRSWQLIIQENPAKSRHAALSRFFSAPSLNESGSALPHKETITTGDRKGEKSDYTYSSDPNPAFLIFAALPLFAISFPDDEQLGVKPMSFEDLSKLLNVGDVDHILVTDSLAIVYAWGHTLQRTPLRKFMIDIESPKSFTEELDKTQAALGVRLRNYVPVTYVDAINEESKP